MTAAMLAVRANHLEFGQELQEEQVLVSREGMRYPIQSLKGISPQSLLTNSKRSKWARSSVARQTCCFLSSLVAHAVPFGPLFWFYRLPYNGTSPKKGLKP